MRPIDAEHLKRWILARWEETAPTSPYPLRAIDIIDQVDREDTIDAVPVIRCKDCKYYEGLFCKWWQSYTYNLNEQDGYCHRAERKDDE